jgi:hypothetical protein
MFDAPVGQIDSAPPTRTVGGQLTGLWTGAVATLHLRAGAIDEDLVVGADQPFVFASRLLDGATYTVSIADDGPDHDCAISNETGRVMGGDVSDVTVACTNLIPHSLAISSAVPFVFDPRVTQYPLAVSLVQQEVSVLVAGPTLTLATLAGQPVTVGSMSPPAAIAPGQSTVQVAIAKGTISQRYDLGFDRGAQPITEAAYARASNPGADDGFGVATAASADWVAVGAAWEDSSTSAGVDNGAPDSGAVYVFRRGGDTWSGSQRVKGSAITTTRQFGHALAIDGDVMVVGADGDDARGIDAGAAYVFRRAGGLWLEEARLTASDAQAGDQFGFSVAVSGDLIAVSAPFRQQPAGSGTSAGTIYTFQHNGTSWAPQPLLPVRLGSVYGWRIAMDRDVLAVAGLVRDRVFVYRRSGGAWVAEPFPDVSGSAVDVDRDVIAVGQPIPNTPGTVRIVARSGGAWTETAQLVPIPASGGTAFGNNLAIRGDLLVTSDTFTHAYMFQKVGGTWVPLPRLMPSGSPVLTAGAPKVDIAGNSVVVGNFGDGGPGNAMPGSGTAWIFR